MIRCDDPGLNNSFIAILIEFSYVNTPDSERMDRFLRNFAISTLPYPRTLHMDLSASVVHLGLSLVCLDKLTGPSGTVHLPSPFIHIRYGLPIKQRRGVLESPSHHEDPRPFRSLRWACPPAHARNHCARRQPCRARKANGRLSFGTLWFHPLTAYPLPPTSRKVLFHCIKWLTFYTAVPPDS
ncbi:hypothetical protein B0H19DRAFT_1242541 [Mycena capillaripes]|nr:hypothetical protein B0H19DRAFT_1242541 [Mycena capillaripes]